MNTVSIPSVMRRRERRQSVQCGHNVHGGYSLVELMIAITVGLLLLSGLTLIFVNSSRSRDEIERANQQTDNGRYAMQLLSDDLRNAGYLASFDPVSLATPAAKPDPCATDLPSLVNALPIAVQGYDSVANAPTCLNDVRTGTDILVVRRASACAVGEPNCDAQVAGAPYFQASGCSSATELAAATATSYYKLDTDVSHLTLHQKNCTTTAPYQQYLVHIYFVANNDKSGDGIPTLKRAELGASGFSIVPLVEGIEDLQIDYGLDTASPTTGSPAVYAADPDSYNGCAAAACMGYWRNTVAAKINVLARNITASAGYKDTRTYTIGTKADGTSRTAGPFNDAYRRHAYTTTVRLYNTAGRNMP